MALNFPNSPTDGQIYTDTPSGNRWVWDSANTIWKSTSTFTQTITVAATAPGSPVVGQLWWSQDYGRLLVYYSDGTSSQWVDASPSDYTSQLAYGVANAAFAKANNALANTSGTFAGDLTITGNTTIKASNISVSGNTAQFKVPTQTILTSGSGTYTVPTGVTWLRVRMVGAGGGGGGSGLNATNGSSGGDSTFGGLTAGGGGGAPNGYNGGYVGGYGGSGSGGDVNSKGGAGQTVPGNSSPDLLQGYGGSGGCSVLGGGGSSGVNGAGGTGQAGGSYGGGGGGVGANASYRGSAGGGAGGYCEKIIASPTATYSYAVGSGGAGGASGSGGGTGGAGAGGVIIIEEHYSY